MEKRLTMILACLFLSLGMALAQTTVTGTVVSHEDGQPIIGATVRVVDANTGAVTDADGRFSLSLPAGHNKLRVSYVGMETQDVTVKGNSVRVVLLPVLTDLDEVMVVAYGTTTKSAFTGSAAVIKSKKSRKRPMPMRCPRLPARCRVCKSTTLQVCPVQNHSISRFAVSAQSTPATTRLSSLTARLTMATITI